MSKDLYVKNISPSASEEEVRKLFAVAGKVSYIHMVRDAKSGEFRNCAYVKMASEFEAKEALVMLDGARLIDRIISVSIARPQKPAGGSAPPLPGKTEQGKPAGRRRRQ